MHLKYTCIVLYLLITHKDRYKMNRLGMRKEKNNVLVCFVKNNENYKLNYKIANIIYTVGRALL